MLHVLCGESAAESLSTSGVAGEVTVWADVLHDGPAPDDVEPDEWNRLRAEFISSASAGKLTADGALARLEQQDAKLAAHAAHEEVVLWFDACLYDQLILVRHLDWFGAQNTGTTTLSLICIGEFPGLGRIKGLGELRSGQLASLLDDRATVTEIELTLASAAWAAFRSPRPTDIEHLLQRNLTALPFLGDAMRRHLEQFPSATNGLSRLENETLIVVSAGASKPSSVFAHVDAFEETPFFGDTTLWACVNRLASGGTPLLKVDGPGPLPQWEPPHDIDQWTITATDLGREALAGRQDWALLSGIDRWLGGVHLTPDNLWRWDPARQSLLEPR